ncbi:MULTISPECIES: energy transducer TonB [unclassified Pseudoalteromonas]|uniref:energy transducer TonB n=1 Tax=unclassified Pseudoalteromonas TaxID=194690 RepID=UPI0030154824
MNNLSLLLLVVISAGIAVPSTSAAKQELHLATVTKATPVERVKPRYPKSAALRGGEGWVKLSYIVNEDGSVSSPIVEDSSGQRAFERQSLRAIKKWRYQPAKSNGTAIKQCKNSVMMSFRLSESPLGASKRFIFSYREASELLDEGNLKAAQEKIDKILERERWNLYEETFVNLLQSRYYQLTKQPEQQLRALKGIIWHGKKVVEEEIYAQSLTKSIFLQAQLQQFKGALNDYDLLEQLPEQEQFKTAAAPVVEKIKAVVADADRLLITEVKVTERASWTHQLIRNAFTLSGINGELHNLEVRCENKYSSFTIKEQVQWTIPKSWGECSVVVFGEPNSQFRLAEVKAEAS